ncbi:MAG: RnfABCDGE type electron transport complex subunit B [Spirochaetaceae bacterium]|nr:MAG: RnfABCDGE type electron transport complex subunit B [Spirochaetaceae bacterium]
MNIFLAVASVASLGIVFGILLSIAARFFAVQKDQRLEAIEKILPQVNCGACGFAGCASYAAALVGGETAITLCTPGGAEVAHKIADILELEKPVLGEKKITQVHCKGGKGTAQYTCEYSGVKDCNALFLLGGGNKACKYGCLGMGSCIKVCPVDAIDYDHTGLVVVNKKKCIGCGKCIEVCPTKVMKFIPKKADYIVACNSKDSGPATKKTCSVGCIGCKICEKKSPEGGFVVTDYLSVIDYSKTGERGEAADKCPPKCIIRN